MKRLGLSLVLVAGASAQQFSSSSWNVKDGEVSAVFGPPRAAPVITGAPYSADQMQDYHPPDGNSSPRSNIIGHFARDTQGRTRMERAFKMAPIMMVEIFDPVAGVAYLLDHQRKTAHRMSLPPAPAPTAPAADGPGTIVEKLGRQSIEGVGAEGTRRTFRGPVNSGRPALVVETWESPELKITLLTKSSNGYTSTMTPLSRSEPDAALFRPPADYSVVDENAPFPMTIKRR
jgi:hypothetical protein